MASAHPTLRDHESTFVSVDTCGRLRLKCPACAAEYTGGVNVGLEMRLALLEQENARLWAESGRPT